MAIAHNFSGLLATRFFLGAMEASVGEHSSTREMNLEDEDQVADFVLLPSPCFCGNYSNVVEKGRAD